MDYEHQPANHLSFRLAQRVIVPRFFPDPKLRRYGAIGRKVLRYDGFKEELYLAGFSPDPGIMEQLRLDRDRVVAVFRQPPSGALYHRTENRHFEDVVDAARRDRNVQPVLLPRGSEGRSTSGRRNGVIVPPRAIDALSLIAQADLVIGGGGTMTRESALLGTPTYTVFMGRRAAADDALMRLGLLKDLRPPGLPAFVKRTRSQRTVLETEREKILCTIEQALTQVT
jgi:predicted glycosyltransferase